MEGILSSVIGIKQLHKNANTKISNQEISINIKVSIARKSSFPQKNVICETGITKIFFSVPSVYSRLIIHAYKIVNTIGANKSIKNINASS